MHGVTWTAYDPLERGAQNEDPLGFYTYALRLAEEWLPGITTRTRRLRYYSMVCGGLDLIEKNFSRIILASENHDAERTRLFMRWERLWVVWNVAVGESALPGLIGRNKTEPLFKNGSFSTASLDFPFIQRQPDLGALGAYKSSLVALGFMRVDTNELTTEGERLADIYWQGDPSGTARRRSVASLKAGRLRFPRAAGRLAAWGQRLGIEVSKARVTPESQIRQEAQMLSQALLPSDGNGARRTEVFDFVRQKRLGTQSEVEILREVASGAERRRGNLPLARRAAAILASEAYRAALMEIVNLFLDTLRKHSSPLSPACLARHNAIADLVKRARATKDELMKYTEAAEFKEVFDDFPLGSDLEITDGVNLLRHLLTVHQKEMEKRRSPRWFYPVGTDLWELNPGMALDSETETPDIAYNYRTYNLIRMAREAGRRI